MAKESPALELQLRDVLRAYRDSFSAKTYSEENEDTDPLMDVFGITPSRKRENRQYWGRELGMCWQHLVTNIFSSRCTAYSPALQIGDDEPCDCCIAKDAIDTKYRIGSGDSGTLKKFRSNGKLLADQGFRPVLLIVRTDNLAAAITACTVGGWTALSGQAAFAYIHALSGFDLREWLNACQKSKEFLISKT